MSQSTIPLGDAASTTTAAGDFAHLSLDRVWADPDQPRRSFDEAFLAQLAESIKAQGVIQPIVVRPTSVAEATYTIISGESRWRASQMAGKETIPALIRRDLSESDIAVMQILENLQRRDLSLIETCEGVTRLVKEIGLDKAADQLGMSKSWVSRHSTLAELPNEVLDLVKAGKLESIELAKDVAQLVQLDQKQGAVIVGRLKGVLTHYGHATVAPDPERLATLDEAERQRLIDNHEQHARPPTRADIRAALSSARHAESIKQQAAERRQASKDDPAAIKQRQEAKEEAAKAKATAERRKAFHLQAKEFEQLHTTALSKALGLKVPKRQEHGWAHRTPALVRCRENLSYVHSTVPAKFETLKFCLEFDHVGVDLLRKVKAAGFTSPIKMEIEWGLTISVEQAEAIEKILGSQAVAFSTEIDAKASEVPAFVARFDKPVSSKPGIGQRTMTSIEQFLLSDAVATKDGERIKAADFHAAYEKWCKKNRLTAFAINHNAFGAAIEAEGIEKKRLSTGWHYLDIQVTS